MKNMNFMKDGAPVYNADILFYFKFTVARQFARFSLDNNFATHNLVQMVGDFKVLINALISKSPILEPSLSMVMSSA